MSQAEVEVLRLSRYAGPPWKPFERFAHSRRDVLVFCSLSVPQAFGWLQAMYSHGHMGVRIASLSQKRRTLMLATGCLCALVKARIGLS